MAGAENTQGAEFPADPDLYSSGTVNADEFRDLDLGDTAVKHKADFSSVPNETMGRPHDSRAEAAAERRVYANGPMAVSDESVSAVGARRYSRFVILLPAGTDGYPGEQSLIQIGRATCRASVCQSVWVLGGSGSFKKKKT